MGNDISPRDDIWRRFPGDEWDSFDALPAAIRRRLQQHAYDAWSSNALLLWRTLRRRHASSARAETLLLRHIDHCERLEREAFAAIWQARRGTVLPHLAAAASVLRDRLPGAAQDGGAAARDASAPSAMVPAPRGGRRRARSSPRRGATPAAPRSAFGQSAATVLAAAMLALAGAVLPASGAWAQDDSPARGDQPCDEGIAVNTGSCLSGEVLADGFANTRGGVHRGVAALTQLKLGLGVDLGALAGLDGWSFQFSGFAIYGRQPTPTLVGSLSALSNAEALSTVRLGELWLQRTVDGVGSVRFGQLTADSEFFTAQSAGGLINGTFGWPLATSTALPSGGPGYPFATPGVRLAIGDPDDGTGLRAAIFAGDPAGRPGESDPQRHNRFGTNFSLQGGSFTIAEAVTGGTAPKEGALRPWVLKAGGWFHNGGFSSQRGDPTIYNSDPASAGILPDTEGPAPRLRNDYGLYGVGEAVLWRGEHGSLATFARGSLTPASRNLLGAYVDGGLAWAGPFGREADTISLGAAWARTGSDGRALDRALRARGVAVPLRDREITVEANYNYAVVAEHLSVQPVVQYISHPGAGIPDGRVSTGRGLRDAVVVGLRLRATL
ncbi:DUF6525 family protein [Roseomonas elaeocarpi]|uniref:DUF6525 family protein n=1 Tax=Roseomonas elaeocarpi TaxID=907779 RepID=A0ABV6JV18_9PROT